MLAAGRWPRLLALEGDRGHRVAYLRQSCAVVGLPLSAELLRLPEELARVAAPLDDPASSTPFASWSAC